MKITLSPQEAARFFIAHGELNPDKLGSILEMYATKGFVAGLEKAKERYREMHPGGCRMLSQGQNCTCFLCSMDDLRKPE